MHDQPDDFNRSTEEASVRCKLEHRGRGYEFWSMTVRSGNQPMSRTVELSLDQARAVREALYELERRIEQAAEHAEDLSRAGM